MIISFILARNHISNTLIFYIKKNLIQYIIIFIIKKKILSNIYYILILWLKIFLLKNMLVMFNFFLHWKKINLRFVLTLKLIVSHSQLRSCILVFGIVVTFVIAVWKKLFYKKYFWLRLIWYLYKFG